MLNSAQLLQVWKGWSIHRLTAPVGAVVTLTDRPTSVLSPSVVESFAVVLFCGVFRRGVLWFGDVYLGPRSTVHPFVTVFRTFFLHGFDILLTLCMGICFYETMNRQFPLFL